MFHHIRRKLNFNIVDKFSSSLRLFHSSKIKYDADDDEIAEALKKEKKFYIKINVV